MENRNAQARSPDAPTSRLCCRRSRGVIHPFAYSDSHVFTPKSNRRLVMTKIKTLSLAGLLFAAAAVPVFAQDGSVPADRHRQGPSSSANSEKPGINGGVRDTGNIGTGHSETTEPGDFAVTDGLSDRSGRDNPTGQVDPGTSNAPAGNSGGE
jgi:hypothetical protein